MQLSDIHYDHEDVIAKRVDDELLRQVVEITNNVEPDIIVLTGDYVQFDPEPVEILAQKWLSQLKSKKGIYAVLGNHDDKQPHSGQLITDTLTKYNIHVLENETAYPYGEEEGFIQIIGFGDLGRKHFHLEKVEQSLMDTTRPRLILSHNPDSAQLLTPYRADVILSGHTHGGQILLPFIGTPLPYIKAIIDLFPKKLQRLFPFIKHLNVVKNWKWMKGLHAVKNDHNGVNYLYTNRGLATHPPMRFLCNPEVTVIDLVPE